MRAAVVLGLLSACSVQNGALLVATGDIEFDQVDVYFGSEAGSATPTTPRRAVAPVDEIQALMHRSYAMEDEWGREEKPRTSWSYFLPSLGQNTELGDYVLVLASRQGSPVAVGEYFDFVIPTEEAVYRYAIPLLAVDHDAVETWGRPQRTCVRWTHARGQDRPDTVAVVDANDEDCDSFLEDGSPAADCDSLSYCDGSGLGGCIGGASCVTMEADACAIAACTNKDGAPASCSNGTTCLETELCRKCKSGDTEQLLDCAINDQAHTASDYPLPLQPDKSLCTEPFTLPVQLPFPCEAPDVVGAGNVGTDPLPFTFDVAQSMATPNTCDLVIIPETPGATFEGSPHVVISIDGAAGSTYTRAQFIVGFVPGGGCDPGAMFTFAPSLNGCGL